MTAPVVKDGKIIAGPSLEWLNFPIESAISDTSIHMPREPVIAGMVMAQNLSWAFESISEIRDYFDYVRHHFTTIGAMDEPKRSRELKIRQHELASAIREYVAPTDAQRLLEVLRLQ